MQSGFVQTSVHPFITTRLLNSECEKLRRIIRRFHCFINNSKNQFVKNKCYLYAQYFSWPLTIRWQFQHVTLFQQNAKSHYLRLNIYFVQVVSCGLDVHWVSLKYVRRCGWGLCSSCWWFNLSSPSSCQSNQWSRQCLLNTSSCMVYMLRERGLVHCGLMMQRRGTSLKCFWWELSQSFT